MDKDWNNVMNRVGGLTQKCTEKNEAVPERSCRGSKYLHGLHYQLLSDCHAMSWLLLDQAGVSLINFLVEGICSNGQVVSLLPVHFAW